MFMHVAYTAANGTRATQQTHKSFIVERLFLRHLLRIFSIDICSAILKSFCLIAYFSVVLNESNSCLLDPNSAAAIVTSPIFEPGSLTLMSVWVVK